MNNRNILTIAATGLSALGAGMLIYGALVESKRLVVDRFSLKLKNLPERLDGLKIGVLSDFHIGHSYSI